MSRQSLRDPDQVCSIMLVFSAVMLATVGGAIGISMLLLPASTPAAVHAAIGFFGGPTALICAAHSMKALGVTAQ